MQLLQKKIILGITGGIACYKSAELTRLLIKAGADVQIVMTANATRFVTPLTFQALSGKPVFYDQWDSRIPNNMPHIDLTRVADLLLIAPASANFIFKLANGVCDDLLSTLSVARPAHLPFLVAPAMNVEMWQNPATQRNLIQLKTDGIQILDPQLGEQACGETGFGRMVEPEQIVQEIISAFQPKFLQGKNVIVTAGSTYEPLDPVRGISNLSSGKMGYAIAQAAQQAGANVLLISGVTQLVPPISVNVLLTQTAQEMYQAVMRHITQQDIFISVAAVADWAIKNPSTHKIKKTETFSFEQFQFVKNPDILAEVSQLPNAPYCVGFAAESENLLANAQTKRIAKNVPLLVANLGPSTFGKDNNEIILIDTEGEYVLPKADKLTLARQLVQEIANRL